ncbi:MAG: DUF2842 domain-containing protein [Alphaproteobacteria bacterium]|nr:DUF2842 domain-containing protein [Alphaproteobacteria bacterium]
MFAAARKIGGLLVLLAGLLAYLVGAVSLHEALAIRFWPLDILYYALAGIAWAFPARYLVRWMTRA